MKIGDLIIAKVSNQGWIMGTIIEPWEIEGWWEILTEGGELIRWPEAVIEVISES